MKEDFLHYIWKYRKFTLKKLNSSSGELINIIHPGIHNTESAGPDFFNALIEIGQQKWAGNVEIHINSSDWYAHNHQTDENYNNVILHVVWNDDVEVFDNNNNPIPTLALEDCVDKKMVNTYKRLISSKERLNCKGQLTDISQWIKDSWSERLYFERLEEKSIRIKKLLEASKNDWEAVLFKMLTRNFGLNTNAEAFASLAESLDFSVVRKCFDSQIQLESLLLGQAGLLNVDSDFDYVIALNKNYEYLKSKFRLSNDGVLPFNFFKLRPPNFPSVRIAQLSALFATKKSLFSVINETSSLEELYRIFSVEPSDFWKTHYTLTKESKSSSKKISKTFADLLIINTIIPIKFAFNKSKGQFDEIEGLIHLISQMKSEKNRIVDRFKKENIECNNALQSQAFIQLYNNYCEQNRCIHCSFGNYLLKNP